MSDQKRINSKIIIANVKRAIMKIKYHEQLVLTLAVIIITGIVYLGGNQKLSRMTNADVNDKQSHF